MKKELLKGFTMLMLIVALALASAVVSANAQSSKSNRVVADIPFEFSVGYFTMPAGEYSAKLAARASDASIIQLMIQSGDGTISAVRLSEATKRMENKTPARLVFHRYGQRYFLAEVWNGTDNTGRQLLQSLEERAIERELATTKDQTAKTTYEIVEVAAAFR